MREQYSAPELIVIGSVNDLTQAINLSLQPDNFTGLPIAGPPPATSG